jgi:predicted phosphoadenosine phosphosulfate sulfurtransferase
MNKQIENWITTWKKRGYVYDIPDEAPLILEHENKVPSYRRICFAIMRNDSKLQSLGFVKEPCFIYNQLKKVELQERGKITQDKQMRLFDECLRRCY